jgi:hypothetical protein
LDRTAPASPTPPPPDRLYHFTCAHGYRKIGRYNCLLIPQGPHPLLNDIRVIWLTTLADPDQETTGLGQVHTTCNRMAFRYVATDLRTCRPWLGSAERKNAPPDSVEILESYGDPEHWWITSDPTPVQFDRARVLA